MGCNPKRWGKVVSFAVSRGGVGPGRAPRGQTPCSSPSAALQNLHMDRGRFGNTGKRLFQVAHRLVHGAAAGSRGNAVGARPRSPPCAPWDSLLSCRRIHLDQGPAKSTSAARAARRLATRPAPPSFESAARCAPPHPDPEALGGGGGATSDWRRSGYGQPLLTGFRATSVMGKKHKKHKAEWRSSYEGAEPTGGVSVARTGGRRRSWGRAWSALGGGGERL